MTAELVPPHNLDYERCVLCDALLGYRDAIENAVDVLSPSHFYRTQHQVAWAAICEMHRSGETVELVTVARKLRDAGTLASAGGSEYLAKVTDHYPSPDPKHTAGTIRHLAVMRELIERANAIQRRAFEHGGDYAAAIDFASEQIRALDTCGGGPAFHRMDDLMHQAMDRYEALRNGMGAAIRTGFLELDSLTGGFSGSLLVILAARPGIGKTAMMLSMARNMARRGVQIGILSLEMDKEALVDRMVSMETGINCMRLCSGVGPTTEQWIQITGAGGRISNWRIHIDDGGATIQEIKRRCRAMAHLGAQIIFIDQLSKIGGGDGRSEYEKRSSVVNQLAELKKELRLPIVLLAQINRQGEPDPPMLANLKSTGSLEEDADIVLIGHRRWYYSRDDADIHDARWDLAKQRRGPTRVLRMHWEPKLTLFRDLPQTEDEFANYGRMS